ncbi:type 1 glutamine amidotransferase [Bacillus wiedmannii]|uniref:type 1 glutamine amidotransferase n=1 Tax=Bacillus wiedmannii TaxID=1890302 RepID=UPI003FA2CE02
MGVYDEKRYPWIGLEKQLIKKAIQHRKLVLGICLGAQLIAEVLGGKVFKNHHKEIDWFPVKLSEEAKQIGFFSRFPEVFVPFHRHADTFQLPPQAKRIAYSKGCVNQAYVYEDHVVGLQFHLESNAASIERLIFRLYIPFFSLISLIQHSSSVSLCSFPPDGIDHIFFFFFQVFLARPLTIDHFH